MAAKNIRAVIAGAATALGKELADQINEAAPLWDVSLADAGAAGTVTAAGDEAVVVAPLEASSFPGADVVFFAGDAAATRDHWRSAQAAGALVVDLTGALEDQPGVVLLSPDGEAKLDLNTTAAAVPHPAAWMLASVLERAHAAFGDAALFATVLEPASQAGNEAMDELHQQTVALLSFQPVPQEIFDAQLAFTLRDTFGPAARVDLSTARARMQRHVAALAPRETRCTIQLLQAPVFHGYTVSAWLQTGNRLEASTVQQALRGLGFSIATDAQTDVNNQAASGQGDVLLRVQTDAGASGAWLWMAADNLQLTARHAIACANQLLALRPSTGVQ